MNEDMHEDMQRYYSRNKLFLSQLGAWPYQPKILKVLLPCLILLAQIFNYFSQVRLFYDSWGDVDMLIEGIVNIILLSGASAKLINIVVNNRKFQSALENMNLHWQMFRSDCELHILRYYADIGQIVTKYYAAYIYAFVVTFTFVPLIPRILDVIIPLNESRPYVYVLETEYGVDKEKYYYPIMLHCYLAILMNVGIMISVDTMYIVCVLHSCSLFIPIGNRLENIFDDVNTKLDDSLKIISNKHHHLLMEPNSSTYNEDYHELMICLRKHQLALEYVDILESTFTYATFFLLFLNVIVMSLVGLQVNYLIIENISRLKKVLKFEKISCVALDIPAFFELIHSMLNKLGQTGEVIRFGCLFLGSISHLFCMCLLGQLLMDKSSEVFDKAYCSRWYVSSMKTKSLLKILLHRSLVPCTLSAGRMFIMSMITCSSVLKTAMSYFTAFLSMK